MLILLTLLHLLMGAPLPATNQRIQAVEGQNATVRCHFNRPDSFIARAVEWTYNYSKIVLFSRHDGWINPESADAQFKHRTSLNITDLTRGILSVTIFNVTRSDSGIYTAFAVDESTGDEVTCSAELIVEPKDPQTQRNPSSTSAPPPEGDPDAAENRNDVWKIVLPCFLILAVAVIAVAVIVFQVKRGVMIRICKKGGEPVENGDELKERRTEWDPGATVGGEDQQSAAEEGLMGSETTTMILESHQMRSNKVCQEK